MRQPTRTRRIFDADPGERTVWLPWRRALAMCWGNVRNRRGRFLLTLLGVAITVAFLTSSMTYHDVMAEIASRQDVHARAVLERVGSFGGDAEALKRRADQRVWIIVLSAMLCVTGITNTMLMSVTERSREIGTLKCLGSLDRFVIRLFLLEGAFVGALGSIGGATVGYVLGLVQVGFNLEFGLLRLGNFLGPLVTAVPLAVGAGTALTVLSALYPTYVAARMRPVEAMRVEI